MNEKTLRALVDAGAITRVTIRANAATFYVEASTKSSSDVAQTSRNTLKTWRTLDAAARWVRGLGIGKVEVDLENWVEKQRDLAL